MKRTTAFTLIELLVVMAIVSLLISLLIPALASAKEQSKSIACQANLHGIAAAFHDYASDNRGLFPPLNFYRTTASTLYGQPWPSGTATNPATGANYNSKQYYTNRLALYLPVSKWSSEGGGRPDFSVKSWVCPSLLQSLYLDGGGYGVAMNVISYLPPLSANFPQVGAADPALVKRPGKLFLIGDVWYVKNPTTPYCSFLSCNPSQKVQPYTGAGNNWGTSNGIATPSPRHNLQMDEDGSGNFTGTGTVNVAFYDGHAGAINYLDLKNDNESSYFSP